MTDTLAPPVSGNDRARWAPLERIHVRRQLVRLLAEGNKSLRQLGDQFGVSAQAIHVFSHRHADRIEAVRQDLDNEFAGLWIADKHNRVAEYERDVDQINDVIAEAPDKDLMKVKHTALKSVAEELGHLPARNNVTVQQTVVNYQVVGVDMDLLR